MKILKLSLILSLLAIVIMVSHINARLQSLELYTSNIDTKVRQAEERRSADIVTIEAADQDLRQQLRELADRITEYEQDIKLWNRMTGEMFGEENARYFREGRGK